MGEHRISEGRGGRVVKIKSLKKNSTFPILPPEKFQVQKNEMEGLEKNLIF